MLSSGTLNLKFMQRKQNPSTTTPKPTERRHTKLKDDCAGPREQTTVTTTHPSPSTSKHQQSHQSSTTPTLTIVFEDSLIGFPWLSLSCRRTTCIPLRSANNDILPAHIGRKSYGEFNQAIQKLEQEPIPIGDSTQPTESEDRTTQARSRPATKKARAYPHPMETPNDPKPAEVSRTGRKMSHEYDSEEDQTRVSKKKKQQQSLEAGEQEEEGAGRAFKRPFTSTTIKTKRKTPVEPGLSKAKAPSTTVTNTKPSAQSSSSSKRTKNISNPPPSSRLHPQGRGSIVIDHHHSRQASFDNEAVNRQIDDMFKEARETQTT